MKKEYLILIILSLLIFGVNLALIYPYLFQSAPGWIESIEVSYITMGRFLAQNFPYISFNPVWYLGFPMQLMYVPLIPFSVAVFGSLIGSFGSAYHLISGIAYALVPVSLFFFVYFLTKNKLASLVGVTWFSLAPSIGNIFAHVRAAQSLFDYAPPWRMMVMVYYGEGPHTLAMVFLPLAGLFFFQAIKERSSKKIFLASFFTALTTLSNLMGLYGLAILLGAIFLAGLLYQKEKMSVLKTTALVVGLSYLLSAFWYTPSFIISDLGEGGGLIQSLIDSFPWGALGIFLAFGILIYLVRLLITNDFQAVALLWFSFTFSIVAVFYLWNISLAPQARRLIPEANMALAVLIGLGVSWLTKKARKFFTREKFRLPMELILGLFLLGMIFVLTRGVWQACWWFTSSSKEINQMVEYKMAHYLESQEPSRVFVSANHTFWLNYFTDIWQVRGGFWQAATSPWVSHAAYQITSHLDGEISLLWLKAFGVSHLVVNTPYSTIHYRDFLFPDKFEGLLEPIWENEGDVVYEVPLTFRLAGAVDLGQMEGLSPPQKGDDRQALETYVAWLEKPTESRLSFQRINNNQYQIQGEISQGEGILVQLVHSSAFQARTADGDKVKILKDPLGFMVLASPKAGEVKISLYHDLIWDQYLGLVLTLGTITSLGYLVIRKRRK